MRSNDMMSQRDQQNPMSKKQMLLQCQPVILRKRRKLDGVEVLEHRNKNEDILLTQSCSSSSETVNSAKDSYSSPEYMNIVYKSHGVVTETDSLPIPSHFETVPYLSTPESHSNRLSPLPYLKWANSQEVWDIMVHKEARYHKDHNMLFRHPALHSRMRAILLDWLIEVCEVYRLHRESFYLAQDYIDRYLTAQAGVQKQQLQLLGVTALFVASKMEEIYPPKLAEFAYVTDGACTESEIMEQELLMLKVLNWELTPMTVNSWLSIYLHLSKRLDRPLSVDGDGFLFPECTNNIFSQICQLTDLCMLDIGCLQFSYSTIAASAVCHMMSEKTALFVSGLKWSDIAACVQWMVPFTTTIRESGCCRLKFFKQVTSDDMHNIQTHSVDLHLLDKAQFRHSQMTTTSQSSPLNSPHILTPPQSGKKHS